MKTTGYVVTFWSSHYNYRYLVWKCKYGTVYLKDIKEECLIYDQRVALKTKGKKKYIKNDLPYLTKLKAMTL